MSMFRCDFDEVDESRRCPELERLHAAADCAEHADIQTFIESFVPQLNTFSPTRLWALSGILHDRRLTGIAKFIALYTKAAEAAVVSALDAGEQWDEFMPSPMLLWGLWCERQGHREGFREGWKQGEERAKQKHSEPRSLTVYHNHNLS